MKDPTLIRLKEQITWYDSKSVYNQSAFKSIKITEMIAAAIIPFSAGFMASPYITGGLGIAVLLLEGIQQLNQYHLHWLIYRTTCEDLRHEKYLYLANAGPYADLNDAHAKLAEKIEALISQENARWVAAKKPIDKTQNRGGINVP